MDYETIREIDNDNNTHLLPRCQCRDVETRWGINKPEIKVFDDVLIYEHESNIFSKGNLYTYINNV